MPPSAEAVRLSGGVRVVDRLLAITIYAIPPIASLLSVIVSRNDLDVILHEVDPATAGVLDVVLPIFFVAAAARLALHAWRVPHRRGALAALSLGVLLWATGASVVSSAGLPTTVTFPSPGEGFFLGAAFLMAAYLFADPAANRWSGLSPARWLDAVVACGGALSLVIVAIATPFADRFARQGIPLLLALLYPIIYALLATTVLAQVLLGMRRPDRAALLHIAGFAALATADTSLVLGLARQTYDHGLLLDILWSVGFVLLVAGAIHSSPTVERADDVLARRPNNGTITVLAASLAVLVLAVGSPGAVHDVALAPTVITLLAAGARLLIAVRQANGAAEASRLSLTDDLTDLANRRAIVRALESAIADQRAIGLILIDLNRFKEVNDTLGHAAGDSVLRTVGARLAHAATRNRTLVGRLGGDEFAIVVTEGGTAALLRAAGEVRALIHKPLLVDGMELVVDATVGIASAGETGTVTTTSHELLRQADVALYLAKSERIGQASYDPSRDEFTKQRLKIGVELREGIAKNQLELWYQPQISMDDGRVVAVEALVRWRHPAKGLVPPGSFLTAARRVGLMGALTESTIRMAVADAVSWRAQGLPMKVALNIAPTELLRVDTMGLLMELVATEGLTHEAIIVEVTEDSFLAAPDRTREVIGRLRAGGIEVSIDDYGTGYSSLSYLQDLPLHELKIDRTFVSRVDNDDRSRTIVSTTTELAHALGMRTVAEGVETAEVLAQVRRLDVDIVQGFYFAKPMPAAELLQWLRAHSPASVLETLTVAR